MVITESKLPVKTTVNDIQIFNTVYDISCIFQDIFTPRGGGGGGGAGLLGLIQC